MRNCLKFTQFIPSLCLVKMKSYIAILLFVTISAVLAEDCFDHGVDYLGNDLEEGIYASTGSAEACQEHCQSVAGCEFWTWDPTYNNACWKKSAKTQTEANEKLTSGPKYCGDDPNPPTDGFKIMSYNMFGWSALHDPIRTENMYKVIRAFSPDLLGIQEDEGMSGQIASSIGSGYSVAGGSSAGHSIIYRSSLFTLDGYGDTPLTPHDAYGLRTVQYASFTHKATGKQIDYFNTHFCVCTSNPNTCCGQEGQYDSAKEVINFIVQKRRAGSLLLFSGDLNVLDGQENAKAIQYLKNAYGDNPVPLDDTFRTANGNEVDGTTFPGLGKIDYIFVNQGAAVSSASVDRADYGPASDHLPIRATLPI